jgi:hypothetical protein
MDKSLKERPWITGILFGAWMGGVYALASGCINRLFLPNIPLAPPSGGFGMYLVQYLMFGGFLGLICSLPENTAVGLVLGGLATAIMLVTQVLVRTWGQESLGGLLMYMVCIFLPLIVLLMPISFLIRAGVDVQKPHYDRPYLWARKYIVPFILTLVAISLGALSLYSKDVRLAIRTVNEMILEGKQSNSVSTLPKSLRDVSGYLENAYGNYELTWSDRVDTFMGPVPAGAELSQFLVIARYDNGFSFACVFGSNLGIPNCVVY